MDIAIIQFPGSNCERETILAVKRAGMVPVEFLWNENIEKLVVCDGYVIVGGFSYEDRSRAGALAALDPIMQVLKAQSELGKPILGICNGAQILVEAGLVPGLEHYAVNIALTDNKRIKQGKVVGSGFYNAWVNLKRSNHHQENNAFTRYLTSETILKIPVAHGEGRFVIPPVLLEAMKTNGLGVFQYCDELGEVIDEFPVNPNGSVNNLAAIANMAGNVLAIMPHPERTPVGDPIFHSMRDYIASGYKPRASSLSYSPPGYMLKKLACPSAAHELVIELIITDNHAVSVENTLRQKGIPVTIKRQIHWEICGTSQSVVHQIQASGLLYNERKEFLVNALDRRSEKKSFLVRAKDDVYALEKRQQLKQHFSVDGMTSIRHGVLWHVSSAQNNLEALAQQVIDSGILFNPSSHECYNYA